MISEYRKDYFVDYKSISVKKNFIYNSVFQVLILIVPFITTPYVSRILGADNIGRYSYASAMVTYFTLLAALGSTIYGQRKIAYYRDNKEQMSLAFWNNFVFRCVMSGVSLLLYYIYIFFVEGLNIINFIIALNIINVALDISWFFQGIEDFKRVVIRNLIIRIICLAGIFVFIKKSSDIWKYVLILAMAQLLGSISMWKMMPQYVSFVKKTHPFQDFKEILLIFLPSIAIQVYTVLDKSMIGWITESNYANGCYEQSERIARLAMTVVASIGTVVLPRVANLFQNDNLGEAKEYVYKAFQVVWLLALPIMFGLMGVSSVFIPLFLGPGFNDAIGLLSIFSILVLVVSLANVVGISYLIPTKQQNVYTIAVTISAIMNCCINLILIPRMGAFGAAIASVVAETIGTSIQITYCLIKRQLIAKRIFVSSWRYFLSGFIMFLIVEVLKLRFSEGIISLFILICIGVMSYIVCLFILKDEFFIGNVKKYLKSFQIKKIES